MPKNITVKLPKSPISAIKAEDTPARIDIPSPVGTLIPNIVNDATRLAIPYLPAYSLRNLSRVDRRWHHEVSGKAVNDKHAKSIASIIATCKHPEDVIAILKDESLCDQFTLKELLEVISHHPALFKLILDDNEISTHFEVKDLLKICQLSEEVAEIVFSNPHLSEKISKSYVPLPSPIGSEFLALGKKSEKAATFILRNSQLCSKMVLNDLIYISAAHDSTAVYVYQQYINDAILSTRNFSKTHFHRLALNNKKVGNQFLKDDKRCQAMTEEDITFFMGYLNEKKVSNNNISKEFFLHPIIGEKLTSEHLIHLGTHFPEIAQVILNDEKVRPQLRAYELKTFAMLSLNTALQILRDAELLNKILVSPADFLVIICKYRELAKNYMSYCFAAPDLRKKPKAYFQNELPNLLDDRMNRYKILLACAPIKIILASFVKDVEDKNLNPNESTAILCNLALRSEEDALTLLDKKIKVGNKQLKVLFTTYQLKQIGERYEKAAIKIVEISEDMKLKAHLAAIHRSVAEKLSTDKAFLVYPLKFNRMYKLALHHKIFARKLIADPKYHADFCIKQRDKFPKFPLTEIAMLYSDLGSTILSVISNITTDPKIAREHMLEVLKANRRVFYENLRNQNIRMLIQRKFFNENKNIAIRGIPMILNNHNLKALLAPKILKKYQMALNILKKSKDFAKAHSIKLEECQAGKVSSKQAATETIAKDQRIRNRKHQEEDELAIVPDTTEHPSDEDADFDLAVLQQAKLAAQEEKLVSKKRASL